MPNPKRQHSRQRQRKRRTHYKIFAPHLGKCPQCMKSVRSHRVCPFCGFYKGKPVVEMAVKDAKEETS